MPKRSRDYSSDYPGSKRAATEGTMSTSTTVVTTKKKKAAPKNKKKVSKYVHPAFVKLPKDALHNVWDVGATKDLQHSKPYDWIILNAIQTGTGGVSRAENKVRIHTLWCKAVCWIPYNSNITTPIEFRVIIVVDSQANGAIPDTSLHVYDVLNASYYDYQTGTSNGPNTVPTQNPSSSIEPLAFTNVANRQRFKILRDQMYLAKPSGPLDTGSSKLENFVEQFEFYTRLDIDTVYSGTQATCSNIATNAIWALVICNTPQYGFGTTTTSGNPQVRFRSRVTFSDID